MATYYWIGGSGDFVDLTLTHWSLSSGGSPSGFNPGSSDDVVFDSSGGVGTCTFSSITTVNSFTCNNNSISFNTGGAAELHVYGNLDLAQANKVQIQSYFEGANFKLYLDSTTSGTYTASTNTLNITEIVVAPTSSSTNYYLTSFNTSGTPGYVSAKKLTLTSGNLYLGYNYTYSYRFGNVATTTQHTAVYAYSTSSKSITTSGSNPAVTITAYGDVVFGTEYNGNYTVNLAASTILDFRGSATPRQLALSPAGSSPSTTLVPFPNIQNYTGEDISGGSTGSGVQLEISGAPAQIDQVKCYSAGSVSGSFARGLKFDNSYTTTFTNAYIKPLDVQGDGTNQVILTAKSISGQATLNAQTGGSSNGILRVYNATLSWLNGGTGNEYLAYTADGNIDGGNNSNWDFEAPGGSFLMFF